MFDLFRSREKSVRYLLTGLLVLVALSMVTYLIPGGPGGGGGYGDNSVVAEIGGEALTMRDVQVNLQAAIRNRNIPADLAATMVPQYVNQMISERALAYQAARMGFQVTDEDLARTIRSIFPQLFQDGKFAGREIYAAMLQQQNLTVPEFEANLRKQLLLTKLQNLALEGTVVTPDEVEREFRRRNEKVKLDYIAFTPDKFKSQVSVAPNEVKDAWEKNKAIYQVPEKRSYAVALIDQTEVAKQFPVTDEDLRRAYNQNRDRYRLPERVHVRHILLKTTDKPKEELPKIKARAEDLLKQIKGGADFAELAKKNSEDPGSAVKGGDLDWIARGQTVKNFEDAAFSLKPKEISNVITTEYGFHIIQVLEKEEPRVKPFEEVKAELATERRKQVVFDKMQQIADQMRQELVKNPLQVDAIAAKYGAKVMRADKVSPSDPVPGVGANGELQSAIAGAKKGEVTAVVAAPNDSLVLAVVTDVVPARQADFAEVENRVRESLVDQKAAQMAQQKAKQAQDALKANGGDLKAVAKSVGLEVKTTSEFTQDGAAEGLGPASAMKEVFTKKVGEIAGPIQIQEKIIFAKVAAKTDADMSKLAAERGALVARLKSQKAAERRDLFEDSILSALVKAGKVKINQDAVKRLVSSYQQG